MRFSALLTGAAAAALFLMDGAFAAPTELTARQSALANNKVIVG